MPSVGNIAALILLGASAMFSLVLMAFARARQRPSLWWLICSCGMVGIFVIVSILVTLPSSSKLVVFICGPVGFAGSAVFMICTTRFALFRGGIENCLVSRVIEAALLFVSVLGFIPGVFFEFSELRTWDFLDSSYYLGTTTPFALVYLLTILAGLLNLARLLAKTPPIAIPMIGNVVLFMCGINDVAVAAGYYNGMFVAAFGAILFLVAIALDETGRWGNEAQQLSELKLTLEDRIRQRTNELSVTMEKLAHNERMAGLGRLAASVGHEINNPLTYVISNLELLQLNSGAEHTAYIDDAMEGSRRIAEIVKQLHVISDADDRSTWQAIDVAEGIRTAARTLTPKLKSHHRIDIDAESELFVHGDKGRLAQLFVNILNNAIDALPAEGEAKCIDVVAKPVGPRIAITIKDEGCGIARQFRDKIFEPFASAKKGGLGLGLAISNSIVEELRGEIEINSEEGIGTEVRVRLPRCSENPSRPKTDLPVDHEAATTDSRPLNILIVDDEILLLKSLRESLAGHNVTISQDGTDAIALIRQFRYDVVLCDVVMPNISGLDVFAASVKQFDDISKCFVFMSGGCPTEEIMNRIAETNARFLCKPFSAADVKSLIAECGR